MKNVPGVAKVSCFFVSSFWLSGGRQARLKAIVGAHMSTEFQHFGLRLHQHIGDEKVFELLVNHQPYLPVLRSFESAFVGKSVEKSAGKIAGDYQPGLDIRALINHQKNIVPFVCTCIDPSCWFITFNVEIIQDVNASYVIWHGWRNPYRSDKSKKLQGLYWDYSDLPPLMFAYEQYQAEIARVTE